MAAWRFSCIWAWGAAACLWPCALRGEQERTPLRGAVPRATSPIRVDGALEEYAHAFCTPVEYFHPDERNRPGQIFYLWDDEAIYVGVRTLDQSPFTPETKTFWEGDAIEWYLDVRRGKNFLFDEWQPGSVHCFFSGVTGTRIATRFALRPGREEAIPQTGVETASRKTPHGLEYEFKLPWVNFPNFRPTQGEVIGIDCELSYSDGGARSFRTFAFGGPLSVDHPSNLARVALIDAFQPADWKASGPVMMPLRIDVPWSQSAPLQVEARIAMPPNREEAVGRVVFELHDAHGAVVGAYEAKERQTIEAEGNFVRRAARWPLAAVRAGDYLPVAVVYDRQGNELTRVAPRLASVNLSQGY